MVIRMVDQTPRTGCPDPYSFLKLTVIVWIDLFRSLSMEHAWSVSMDDHCCRILSIGFHLRSFLHSLLSGRTSRICLLSVSILLGQQGRIRYYLLDIEALLDPWDNSHSFCLKEV